MKKNLIYTGIGFVGALLVMLTIGAAGVGPVYRGNFIGTTPGAFQGDGSLLTGIVASGTNQSPALSDWNINGFSQTNLNNLSSTGTVTAASFSGDGSNIVNNIANYGRFYGNIGKQSIYETNSFVLKERFPIGTNAISITGSVGIGGFYAYDSASGNYYTPTNTSIASATFVVHKTNSSAGKDVWVLADIVNGTGPIFFLTNNASPSVFPTGPWFPNENNFLINYGVTETNLVVGEIQVNSQIQNAQLANRTLRYDPYGRAIAFSGSGPIATLALVPGGGLNGSYFTNSVTFVTNNILQQMIDVVEIDRWTISRDGSTNQIFNPILFGNLTLQTYSQYLHDNGLKAGMHADYGVWDPSGTAENGTFASYPYYHIDAQNMVSNGVDYVMIDTTGKPPLNFFSQEDLFLQFVDELRSAQITFNRPLFIHGALAGSFTTFAPWMLSCDGWWVGGDTGTDAFYLQALKESAGWRGYGKYPVLVNPSDAAFTGSASDARRLASFAAIGPCSLQFLNTNNLTSFTVAAFTNSEFRAIWKDSVGNPGWQISSNATGEVWSRQLANGDVAVAMINLTGSAGTLSVSWADLKIAPTNTQLICRDVFERTNVIQSSSLTRAVGSHEGALWRLSPGISTNSIDSTFYNFVASGGSGSGFPLSNDANFGGFSGTNIQSLSFSGSNTNVTVTAKGGGSITFSNGVNSSISGMDALGQMFGNGSGITNSPFVGLKFDHLDFSSRTTSIAGFIAFVATNGVTYYLQLGTNVP